MFKGMDGFPVNTAFAFGSGYRRFSTITQTALNHFKPF